MFDLRKIFKGKEKTMMSFEDIAELLKTDPDTLQQFLNQYQTDVVNEMPLPKDTEMSNATAENDREMILRAAGELIALTKTYTYEDGHVSVVAAPGLPDRQMLTAKEVNAIPESIRPQATGTLMAKDLNGNSSDVVLWYLKKMQKEKPGTKRYMDMYNHFRQGLDILDLDPVLYEIIGTNKNSMGHWLPTLVEANKKLGFFKIPNTTIAKVPMTLLQLSRKGYGELNSTTKAILNLWAMEVFSLSTEKDYFVKTGTYSSKFDFRNCKVTKGKEVTELGEYLMYIQFSANQMASPLNIPCIYGVSTTNEWVVREYVEPVGEYECIYKGLPLRTEFRVFLDADAKKVLGIHPYWDEKVMKKRFAEHRDGHDYVDELAFWKANDRLSEEYKQYKGLVCEKVQEMLPDLHLTGQWSLDVMLNGEDLWLIDMAVAENSAYYAETVAVEDRRPMKEDWIPKIEVEK